MEKIKLEDLVPTSGKFFLKTMNKEYTLRPVNLQDELWMNKELKVVTFDDVLGDLEKLTRLVFRLMDDEHKKDFLVKEVQFVNEDGESVTGKIGGYKLLACTICGVEEKNAVVTAALNCLGFSEELLKKLEDEQKKKLDLALSLKNQTGRKSSTRSVLNMAGPPKNALN